MEQVLPHSVLCTVVLQVVLVLVFHLWQFATSASQIKSEMSFATTAKKTILHFIGLFNIK